MDADQWRALVDLNRLRDWMDTRELESGPISDVQPLTGGTQNVLLLFSRGQRRFVLRRPPAHPLLDGTRTMRREARVLAALAHTSVPHPHIIANCDDKDVLGAGFYLMEPVDGFNPSASLPENFVTNPAYRQRMGLAMIDAIVDLGNVDYLAAGLADFGKIDNYIERQVTRWRIQLDNYRSYRGWPGTNGIPGVDAISSWLELHQPGGFQPGIVHGDVQLSNVMFRYDSPELAAIIDWELVSLGDPLFDLGWMLANWPDPDGSCVNPRLEIAPWDGFPRAAELVVRYAERSGRDMSSLRWFTVLACYKLGVILEGSFARAHAGKAPMETGERLHAMALRVFARTLSWIDQPEGFGLPLFSH